MSKSWSGWLLGMAVLASVATSAPREQWVVVGNEKVKEIMDRDTDLMSLDVEISVDRLAMAMPNPVLPEDEHQDSGELTLNEQPFRAGLWIRGDVATRGVTGIGADETDVTVRVFDLDGFELASQTVFVEMAEPGRIDLAVTGVFYGCVVDEACDDAFTIEVESTNTTRLKVKLDVQASLEGPEGRMAPKDAEIDVQITRAD